MHIYRQAGPFENIPHLPVDQYKAALRRMVKYCHDVIFIDPEGRFLLAQRSADKTPSGTWCIGGQVSAFTELHESLEKTIRRETGLSILKERLAYLGQNRYWFDGKDGGNTSHDALCEIFTVKITAKETMDIRLDIDEYLPGSLRSYGFDDLQRIPESLAREVFTDLWKRYQTSK